MIVITGATGNTGSVIAEKLLAAGEKVRVVGRSAERLQRFVQKGAEAFTASLDDAEATGRALSGATAAYLMIPPDLTHKDPRAYQERISDALAGAVAKSSVPHVVTLSSVGADKPEKVGPVNGLHSFEKKLNSVGTASVLHLRPGYFMENLLQFIGLIKSMGMVAGTLKGDKPIAMIATRDIAATAAQALRRRDFTGKTTCELLGRRHVTMQEAASVIGKAIGKPGLSYTQVPALMVKPALTQMGLSAALADLILEMFEAINSGWMAPQEKRSPENTTPTTLETFVAEEFVPRYQGKAVAG